MMMLYGIKDNVAGVFEQPYCIINEMVLKRSIINTCKLHSEHPWATNGSDYAVYELGSYDERTGLIKSKEPEYKWLISEVTQLHE